jgi:zinc protease
MRQQLLASLAIREQETGEIASLIFDEALFPGHPYGKPVDGFIETVQAITREDMVDFHARFFQPKDLILVIAGAIEGLEVRKQIEDYFADWRNKLVQRPALPAIPEAPKEIIRKHRFIEDKSQTDVILGTYGPNRKSEDYLPAYLGNNIPGSLG